MSELRLSLADMASERAIEGMLKAQRQAAWSWRRRDFLRRVALAGGGLLVGCSAESSPATATDVASGDGGPGADGQSHADVGGHDAGATGDGAALETGDVGSDDAFGDALEDAGADISADIGADIGADSTADSDPDAGPSCPDPFAGGTKIADVPFTKEGGKPLGKVFDEGWDGRLYSDLTVLDSDKLLMNNDEFFIRTRFPDQIDPSKPWQVTISGLVDKPVSLSAADLDAMTQPMGVHLLECSGNGKGGGFGLLGAAKWSGVPLADVLAKVKLQSAATRVLINGFDKHSKPSKNNHSTPGASWIFTLDQLASAGAFLATRMNGVPLPKDHGFPVRLLIPGWYGCCNIKWVDGIELVADDVPATSQMKEFALRTHQSGIHPLAKQYIAAALDQAAMPVRIEKWQVGGQVRYRIVGIMWGGYEPTDALTISFGNAKPVPVSVCPAQTTNSTWTLWSHSWQPTAKGTYKITLHVDDPKIPTRRLDMGYYARWVTIDQV